MPRREAAFAGPRSWMRPEAAKGRRALGGSSLPVSDHPVARKSRRGKGKAGERTCRRAVLTARAREVGLAMSLNAPNMLGAGPFWSRLENPPEQAGALPAAWENVFSELRASSPCFPLIQAVGCSAPGCRLEAGAPQRHLAPAPGLACKASSWSRRQSWQKMAVISQDNPTGCAQGWGGNQRRLPGGGGS